MIGVSGERAKAADQRFTTEDTESTEEKWGERQFKAASGKPGMEKEEHNAEAQSAQRLAEKRGRAEILNVGALTILLSI